MKHNIKKTTHAHIEPSTQKFVNSTAHSKPIYKLSVPDARSALLLTQSEHVDTSQVNINDIDIGKNLSITIVRPKNTGTLPVVLYFHGGGWVLGDNVTHLRLITDLALGAQAAIVFVNYTLAPEAQFPDQIEQGMTALKYIMANPAKLDIDPKRLAIAGDSAGGTLAAAITMLAKDKINIKLQLLFYPVTNVKDLNTKSYNDFADGYWLTKQAMQWFIDQYIPNPQDRLNPLASPLLASINDLKGMPQTLIIVGENDVLRDEGEAYGKKLDSAGVDVTTVRFDGTIHDFVMLNFLKNTPATIGALDLASTTLMRALY
jgi:acetyl esterase